MHRTASVRAVGAALAVVPLAVTLRRGEEVAFLPAFLLLRARHVDLFAGVGILARAEHHRREGHGRGGEVLHLFEREVELAQHLLRQGAHLLLGASGVRRDEVGNQLVGQPLAVADAVEVGVQPFEKREGRLAHQVQHPLLGVLGGYLEAARGVVHEHRAQVVAVIEQVVADAAADEGFLHPLHGPDAGVEFEQRTVVVVQVGAHARVEARGAPAPGAERAVAAAHAVHVGRGAADVGEVALESGHAGHALHLGEDRPRAARLHELALVRRDGAERAAAEAAAVEIDRIFDHLPRRNGPAALVARMGRTLVGEIERAVELLGREHGVRGRDHHEAVARGLHERMHRIAEVALGLDDREVPGEGAVVARALLVGAEADRALGVEALHVVAVGDEGHLADLAQQLGVISVAQGARHLLHHALAHAVHHQVGAAVGQDRGHDAVAPVVVVREAPERGFDAAGDHGRVGKEPLENPRVDRHGAVGTVARGAARRVGVVVAQPQVGRVVVHHRVHGSGRDAEEEARGAELGEVAQVVAPVGLGHDRHAVALGFEQPADDGGAERGVVDVGVAREEDDVERIPSACADLLYGRRQKHVRGVYSSSAASGRAAT